MPSEKNGRVTHCVESSVNEVKRNKKLCASDSSCNVEKNKMINRIKLVVYRKICKNLKENKKRIRKIANSGFIEQNESSKIEQKGINVEEYRAPLSALLKEA